MDVSLVRRAVLAGVLLWLCACASRPGMQPLGVTLTDIRPLSMGLLEQQYALKLRVQNPNAFDIPVAGLAYEVELNGKAFAKGVSRQDTVLPAFGELLLDVTAVSSLSGMLSQLDALRHGAPERVTYRLQGRLSAPDNSSIAFKQDGSLDLAPFRSDAEK
jgi:LEA14-like dessication related protein